MTVYQSTRADSAIDTVEFTPVGRGNFTFIQLRDAKAAPNVLGWLTSPQIGQSLVTQTMVDGKLMLITHGPKTSEQLQEALKQRGEQFAIYKEPEKFEPWQWRGNMSNVGQVLQLLSAQYAKGGIDAAVMGFAVTNLAANMTNVVFGAEQLKDEHRTRFVKESFNEQLARYLPDGVKTPAVNKDHKHVDPYEDESPKTLGDRFNHFMKKNSVTIGEVGLRYLGSISLAFPITRWGQAVKDVQAGKSFSEVVNNAKNPKQFIFYSGIAYLVGKTIALFSAVPDPYHPKSPDAIDSFREDVCFKLSSAVEAGAALALAYEGLSVAKDGKPKIDFKQHKSYVPDFMNSESFTRRDWFGGIGGLLFTSGLLIRFTAPYGTRQADLEDINAHVTEGLSRVPAEKLPQLVADTAAYLKTHFKDSNLDYGKIYNQLVHDLYRYHHIAMPERIMPPSAVQPAEVTVAQAGPTTHVTAARVAMERLAAEPVEALGVTS